MKQINMRVMPNYFNANENSRTIHTLFTILHRCLTLKIEFIIFSCSLIYYFYILDTKTFTIGHAFLTKTTWKREWNFIPLCWIKTGIFSVWSKSLFLNLNEFLETELRISMKKSYHMLNEMRKHFFFCQLVVRWNFTFKICVGYIFHTTFIERMIILNQFLVYQSSTATKGVTIYNTDSKEHFQQKMIEPLLNDVENYERFQ